MVPATVTAPSFPDPAAPFRVLLVDPRESSLPLSGVDLRRASRLEDVATLVNQDLIDVVVVGPGLPAGSVQAWLALRARGLGAPVILLSADADAALESGATDCVHPGDGPGLARAIRHAVLRARAQTRWPTVDTALRQTLKLEAVGRLAGGVAHDFSNLLTVMMGASERLLESLPRASRAHDEADLVRVSCERGAALTRQLLAFSRRQPAAPRPVDLRALMASCGRLLTPLIGEHIFLIIEAPADVWMVHADPLQVEQVVMNLVINARDAMPDGGPLTVRLRNARLEGTAAEPGHEPGEYVQLEVIDSGIGMDGETMAHAFEPFFSTKDESKGTGLGLATVHDIIRELGGHVRIDSAVGRGTTIGVYLPRCAADAAPALQPERQEAPLHGTETVLLTEDEAAIRDLVQTILQRHGYTVIVATGASDALALAEHWGGVIDLLVTDVVMPGGTGPELAERLRLRRRDLKVLYISGYPAREHVSEALHAPTSAFLPKPFTRQMLLKAVRDTLDARIGARTV